MINSLRDEINFLFSGRGMPYEKVALMVAVVVSVVFTIVFGNNYIADAPVAVIDLDNSRYSHELIEKFNSSPYIKISSVVNTPTDPKSLFYHDKNVAVVYLPENLEKNRYTNEAGTIGVFYDNTNTAQSAGIKSALNEIVAMDNAQAGQAVSGGRSGGQISLADRNLFNPVESSSNGETQAFLFFFSTMFFTFATIGMIPRLRMEGKLAVILQNGSPFELMVRIVPYGACLLVGLAVGLVILRLFGDMTLSGNIILFLFTQIIYIWAVGMMSLMMGWTAANPGIASSRMILFIPGGFILGGAAGPLPILSEWVRVVSHFFPLIWEFELVRDIIARGAGFMDFAKGFGEFLLYVGVVAIVFCFVFHKAAANLTKNQQAAAVNEE